MPITFTEITSIDCELTKSFTLAPDGMVIGSAIAHMTQGRARVLSIDDVTDLRVVLPLLTAHQAITCGVPLKGDTALTTRAAQAFNPESVARTNEAFIWPYGPTLFPVDIDVDGAQFQTVDAVLDALESSHPWLRHITRVARPSSSSYVGARGLRGVHVYFVVTRGADVAALAKRMQVEQWEAGRGEIKISKSGALLVRQLSDNTVYQPSRLMFEAAPVCGEGVVRAVPAGQEFLIRAERPIGATLKGRSPEGFLNVQELAPLRDIAYRRFETTARQAKDARRSEAKAIAINYQIANVMQGGGDKLQGERFGLMATRALGDKALPLNWVLQVRDIGPVTVEQVIAGMPESIGRYCVDPFDSWRPDLTPGHFNKAEIVVMGDTPGVWSHKMQTFFKFTEKAVANMASPLDCAAERLCGLIEYPEKMTKSASAANVFCALEILLTESDCLPRLNRATGYVDKEAVPGMGDLLLALARVGCTGASTSGIERAIEALGARNAYDPWCDAVLGLPQWDKVPRLDTIFFDVCGTPQTEATQLTGQLLFAAIVERQLRPGAPCPVIPVLIGSQGCGKSYFVASIAKKLNFPAPSIVMFTDTRTMSMRAARSPIVELAEMSGMGKREVDEVKAWAGDVVDAYRKPYAREEEEHPRRFVALGTANQNELNRDASGNRRWSPIEVTLPRIDPMWVAELPQILAEAKARFCDVDGAYSALVGDTARAVFDANHHDMRRGVGVLESTLDDLMPGILQAQFPRSAKRRIFTTAVRVALDASPSGRHVSSHAIANWFRRQGWQKLSSNGRRYFQAPDDFVLDPPSDDENNDAGVSSTPNPFSDVVRH